MLRYLNLILVFFLFSSLSYSQWISLDEYSIPYSSPKTELISSDASGVVIKVSLPGFTLNRFESFGKLFDGIDIGMEALTSEVGKPEIPHIAKFLAIPDKGDISVEVLSVSSSAIRSNVFVPPVRESWVEGTPETIYKEDPSAYSKEDFYPEKLVKADDPLVFRDFRVARISIFPIRYSPARKEIQAVSSITIRVKYLGGEGINPKTSGIKPIPPSFAKLYKSFIFNYQEVLNERYGGLETGQDLMLCIMPDSFVDTFIPYAEWKRKTGTQIHITKFSEINANANNPTAVKDHIQTAYGWENAPTHVLLIGDKGVAPIKYISYDWTFIHENYFVELEGNDFLPEMLIGRFTNQEIYRLQVMIAKFMNYEKYPYFSTSGGNDWFKKATVCSNNDYASQVETKRYTKDILLNYGNFISVDTLMSNGSSSGSGCTVNLSQVTNAINNGRSFLNYRGEGWSSGWQANCYDFRTTNVNSLNNGERLTFVTSIGCGVAMFDASGVDNCFGEAWIELGTLTAPRGAIAFVGPTSNTHTTYNNKIDMGIYQGMFQEEMESPGEALLRGHLYDLAVYGNIMWVEYHTRIYCVLGDPSVRIWKDIPKNVTVDYQDSIYVGMNQITFTVKDSATGLPVNKARVTITGSSFNASAFTNELGILRINLFQGNPGILTVMITGGNVIPLEKSIEVLTGVENISPVGNAVITELSGNMNGQINPNETGSISFTLKNWGTITSNGIYAKLSVPDSIANWVEITTLDSVVYGTLVPNDSSSGSQFLFSIKPDCPIGTEVVFDLKVRSLTSQWDYYQNMVIHGCTVAYSDTKIDDKGNLLNNYRIDPGETVIINSTIKNIGDDVALNIKGILSSNDQFVTILDSISGFGSILPDSSATNKDDYFLIKVSQNCPAKYRINFNLKIESENSTYPYYRNFAISIPVSMPVPADPTGPDSYGYYAFSNLDTLWKEAPKYSWIEINSVGTLIPKPSGINDFTKTITLPFSFKYYGINYNQLRISSDGWIAFGSGIETTSQNRTLPVIDTVNCMVAPFWDDFYSNSLAGGKLFYYSDIDNHRFIIEWEDVIHFLDTASTETFQVVLNDPAYYTTETGDGEIIFQYKKVEESGSCTIGIENHTENVGILYLFDEYYSATANEIMNETAIKFTTKKPNVVSTEENNNTELIKPDFYNLAQNYPNPFNPTTRINYALSKPGYVTLKIYRIDGQLVRTLQDAYQNAGNYTKIWDGKNESGSFVSSGIYFYRLKADEFSETKKMILLK